LKRATGIEETTHGCSTTKCNGAVVGRVTRILWVNADAVRGRSELVLEVDDAAILDHALADAAARDAGTAENERAILGAAQSRKGTSNAHRGSSRALTLTVAGPPSQGIGQWVGAVIAFRIDTDICHRTFSALFRAADADKAGGARVFKAKQAFVAANVVIKGHARSDVSIVVGGRRIIGFVAALKFDELRTCVQARSGVAAIVVILTAGAREIVSAAPAFVGVAKFDFRNTRPDVNASLDAALIPKARCREATP
jgi:hypothetical protein